MPDCGYDAHTHVKQSSKTHKSNRHHINRHRDECSDKPVQIETHQQILRQATAAKTSIYEYTTSESTITSTYCNL
jgi:hypothetical protein